jgi:hypothetical protein
MDGFELKSEPKKINLKSLVWNFLTLVVLFTIGILVFLFLTIFTNPNSPLNPFPPAPVPTLYQTETPTATMRVIPREATWTGTATIQAQPSRTKAPTWTLLPEMVTPSNTSTPTVKPTEGTATISSTPAPASAEIVYWASTDYHPESACLWLGVAGKVIGTDGNPLQYQIIQMGGTLDGKPVSLFALATGVGKAAAFGPSGYELVLAAYPIASTQTLWIQLLDNTSKPLTGRIYFDTYNSCTQNLVMIDFTRTR